MCITNSTAPLSSHALARNDELKRYLSANEDSCQLVTKSSEQWPEVHFFDGKSLDIMLGENSDDGLWSKLADIVISNPPHGLSWMFNHPMSNEMRRAIVEKAYNPETLKYLFPDHLSDILALRGLLSGGVLRHCLVKRHRVNYGVARPGKKRLAVPFRFADTPDDRSEFAHPDCAIAFTVLSYYYDGLSRKEVMQTLEALMGMSDSAQRKFYSKWLEISSDRMDEVGASIAESLNCVDKIDLTNEVQMANLYDVFSKNMFTVDFYLNYCVFPTETDQFESR